MENRNITINKIVSNYPKTTTTNNHSQNSFFTMKNTCGIAPRSTGLVSLIIQTVSLFLITTLITVLFFHVGGYNFLLYESKNSTDSSNLTNNTTYNILDKDTNVLNDFPMPGTLIQLEKNDISFEDFNSTQILNILQNSNETTKFNKKILNGPFKQISPVQIRIGKLEIDLLPLIRILCIAYVILFIVWVITIIALGISLKAELLDLVYINIFFLMIITIYILILALVVGTLLFYQKKLDWYIILTISIITGGLILCFIFNAIGISFVVVWYRYIDYLNGGKEICNCTSAISQCIKSRTRRNHKNSSTNADYSIPEATRHSNLPYIDDPPIQQFSNF